nr:MAG: hypothetical protein 3 [Leviviridae sp.]
MLVEALLNQFGRDLDLSVERDIAYMRYRVEHEGLSFLTIVLPRFSDALERGLESGRFSCPLGFQRHGSLPRFLGGFFNRVFDRAGEPLQSVDVESLFAIRQICRFFKKLKMECSPERNLEAISHFIEVEEELGQLTPSILGRKDFYLDNTAKVLWSQVFPEIDPNSIVCHHGPGVTADRALYNQRHRIRHWYTRSELLYPSDLHAFPNYGFAERASGVRGPDQSEELIFWDIRDEPGVRVVFVPKTQTAPRVIAIEPTSMQYIQQGLLRYIVPIVEQHRLTRNSIRFSDQSPNQRLARLGSIDKSIATLDLKDASDRVHFCLVQRIFSGSGILEYLEDARSLHATLPNGRNLVLNKFASMGSAICFPVEAMVFYTLVQSAMHSQDGRRPTSQSIEYYSKSIDIYGDDIIVPVEYADVVVQKLEDYGLRVNVNKSFRSSLFRESCGGDFYNGTSVKPVYARYLPPDAARDWSPDIVMSWVSAANQFYELGLWHITQVIRDMVEGAVRRRIPRSVFNDGPGLFFSSFMFTTNLRYNPRLCGWEQRRLQYQPTLKKDDIDGDAIACLNRWGRKAISEACMDSDRSFGSRGTPFSIRYGLLSRSVDQLRRPARPLCALSRRTDAEGRTVPSVSSVRDLATSVAQSQSETFRNPDDRTADWIDYCRPTDDTVEWGKALNLSGPSWSSLKYCLTTSLDFRSSTKRGGFKSKHRWVTLIT